MRRKFVQLSLAHQTPDSSTVVAICEEGRGWVRYTNETQDSGWREINKLPSIEKPEFASTGYRPDGS